MKPRSPDEAAAPNQRSSAADSSSRLARDLLQFVPEGDAGRDARLAFDSLLALPAARRLDALPGTFARFERAVCPHAADPEERCRELRAFVREHHPALLEDAAFARLLDAPRSRAQVLGWLTLPAAGAKEGADRVEELTRALADSETERESLAAQVARHRALSDLGLVTAGVAHDFNNLLQAIVGNLSVALHHAPPGGEMREVLETALQASVRAGELSRRLMSWARARPSPPERVDVASIVEEVLDLSRASAPQNVLTRRELTRGMPAVLADPVELRRVVLNLVFNAWQATSAGGGTVRVAAEIPADRPGHVAIRIEDDGPGIDPDILSRLFEPFFTTRAGGLGLGLAAVRQIVDALGGAIEAGSGSGLGARFRVLLPTADGAGERR